MNTSHDLPGRIYIGTANVTEQSVFKVITGDVIDTDNRAIHFRIQSQTPQGKKMSTGHIFAITWSNVRMLLVGLSIDDIRVFVFGKLR